MIRESLVTILAVVAVTRKYRSENSTCEIWNEICPIIKFVDVKIVERKIFFVGFRVISFLNQIKYLILSSS